MNQIVLIKQVPDTETKVRIKADGSNIEQGDIKWIVNPYDEFAIEEAIKTRDKVKAGKVLVMTLGPARAVEALRTALAMGADDAIHIQTDTDWSDSLWVAKALAEACKKENPEIVWSGKQAIDDDQAAVFGMVAEFLNIPSTSVVVKVELNGKTAKVEREVESGAKHVIEMPLPCLIAVNKGINTPRYASLPGIMKAKKKEIKTYKPADLGLSNADSTLKESTYQLPPERGACKMISGDAKTQVAELAKLLRQEAKVI